MNNPEALISYRAQVVAALKTVIDPELEVNIVDMGLIYAIEMEDDLLSFRIEMTLSSRSCPMGKAFYLRLKTAWKDLLKLSKERWNWFGTRHGALISSLLQESESSGDIERKYYFRM